MSIPFSSAILLAVFIGRILKPSMIADADTARLTSLSEIAPTPPAMTLTPTSELLRASRDCLIAS